MLNVGPLELLVVLAVALIVVGPERLPELARSVGRALRQFRDVQDEVRDMVRMGVDDEMRQAAADVKKATGDLTRATDVKGAVRKVQADVRAATGSPGSRRRSHVERAVPTSPRPGDAETPAAPVPDEAAGPPADRLVDDGAAAPQPPASPAEPDPAPPAEVPDDPGATR